MLNADPIFPNIFYLWLVEPMNVEPTDIEGWLHWEVPGIGGIHKGEQPPLETLSDQKQGYDLYRHNWSISQSGCLNKAKFSR